MKLPNFYLFEPLNALKEKMGIARDKLGNIDVPIDPGRLTQAELERLTSQDGLDISLDDLRVLEDGTLAYKDSRVLLYIRDVTVYGDHEVEPRYHLANCSTLENMREKKRFNRYVISTRTDGKFNLNVIKGLSANTRLTALSVCQNCLGHLRYNGFHMHWSGGKRITAVRTFELLEFFQKFPKSLHTQTPKYNSDNAPLNTYTSDFEQISRRARAAAGFKCQECGVDCSSESYQRYLHTHHVDGDKSNNTDDNLNVLCLVCHAEEHPHMRGLPEFQHFKRLRAGLLQGREGTLRY